MVEPLAAVLRNSLFPVRSLLQGTSSTLASSAGAMYYHEQHSFFSSNLFGPMPRQVKGKERERDESRLPRVLQCREWSCRSTRHLLYCPEHGLPFMLQELLPPRERPVRRFQSPRAQIANRHSKHSNTRSRILMGPQRRHASNATRSTLKTSSDPDQPEASTSASPSAKRYHDLTAFRRLAETPVDEFDLEVAWGTFKAVYDDPKTLHGLSRETLIQFTRRFCDKLESFYTDERRHGDLKKWKGAFQNIINRMRKRFLSREEEPKHRLALLLLVARCRALHGQVDDSIEILQDVRKMWRRTYLDPEIANTYSSICASIFHHNDALHVITFLDQHFLPMYFLPPYCYLFLNPEATESIQNRYPRLLSILSTIRNPISLFRTNLDQRSQNWHTIGSILILAYCTHNLPQLALLVHDAMKKSKLAMDNKLKLQLVRALARAYFFDDAFRVFATIPSDVPEYTNTGIHLFALQGDTATVYDYYNDKKTNKSHHNNMVMLLFSLAVEGKTRNLRKLFNEELYEMTEEGKYKNHSPTVIDYAVAIYACARRGDPEDIPYWLDRMSADGIKPNLHVYSSIIESHLPSGNLAAIADVLDHVRKSGLKLNAVVYTNIITALSRYHKASMAERMFKRALREGIEPDNIMVGALLNCYVEAGQWEDVVALFKSIESNAKSPIQLTIELYNTVLKAYVLMGAPFRVVATLFEKLDANPTVSPTDVTFALLLQSACDSGYMRAALDIFKEMDRRAKAGAKSLINAYVFTILMSGFLRKGNKEQAMAIYEDMLNRGIKPTSVTFNTVLSYYSNELSEESLRIAYEFMTRVAKREEDAPVTDEHNVRRSPLQMVYEPLLRGCAASGNVEGFEKLLGEMLDAGGQMSIPILTAMMDLYRRKDRPESARKVWEHLLELGRESLKAARFGDEDVTPTTDILCHSLTIYLDMLSRSGEHEEVLQTWQEYQQSGFRFNFFNWNRLGTYLICAGQYERAFEVMERVILPYVRLTLHGASSGSSSPSPSSENSEEKDEAEFVFPFDVLNKTNLSFLQSAVAPTRPSTSSSRSKVIQNRSQRDPNDTNTTTFVLSKMSPPHSVSSKRDTSAPPAALPEFARPLFALSRMPEGAAPKVQYTLLQHLLIGYQRLRAGQPAIPSVDPGSMGDTHYADYSSEQRARIREQLEYIHHKYPDSVRAVLDFQEQEKNRMGEVYEKMYIWG